MQKSPILPAPPFQNGDPVFSNPSVAAEEPAAEVLTVVPYRMLMGIGLVVPLWIVPLAVIVSL